VKFLAFLVPSRTSIPEYRAYTKEVFAQVEEINARHARSGWTPITVFHEHNRLQALVAMSLYDVLLVNPLRDGMNLVSKEGPVVNQRDGVLVLSVSTGSYAELRDGVLSVRPEDITGTAEALHTALSLPPVERRERAMRLRQAVLRHDLDRWLRLQLEDLNAVQQGEPLGCDGLSPAGDGGSRWVGDVTAV
jgi:trehalose 6-phosphate synthase